MDQTEATQPRHTQSPEQQPIFFPTPGPDATELPRTPPPSVFNSEPIMMADSDSQPPVTESVVTRTATLDTLQELQKTAPGIFKQHTSAILEQQKPFGNRTIDNVRQLKNKVSKRPRQEVPEESTLDTATTGSAAASGLAAGSGLTPLPWTLPDLPSSDDNAEQAPKRTCPAVLSEAESAKVDRFERLGLGPTPANLAAYENYKNLPEQQKTELFAAMVIKAGRNASQPPSGKPAVPAVQNIPDSPEGNMDAESNAEYAQSEQALSANYDKVHGPSPSHSGARGSQEQVFELDMHNSDDEFDIIPAQQPRFPHSPASGTPSSGPPAIIPATAHTLEVVTRTESMSEMTDVRNTMTTIAEGLSNLQTLVEQAFEGGLAAPAAGKGKQTGRKGPPPRK